MKSMVTIAVSSALAVSAGAVAADPPERDASAGSVDHSISASVSSLDELDGSTMLDVLRGDVVSYNKLAALYDTELKMQDFKHTKEYAALVDELKQKKKDIIGKRGYVKFGDDGRYDLKHGLMTIKWPDSRSNGPRIVNDFVFPSLPCSTPVSEDSGDAGWDAAARAIASDSCEMRLAISRDVARQVEAAGKLDVYLVFTVGEASRVSYTTHEPSERGITSWRHDVWEVTARKPILIVTGSGSDDVLFKKAY